MPIKTYSQNFIRKYFSKFSLKGFFCSKKTYANKSPPPFAELFYCIMLPHSFRMQNLCLQFSARRFISVKWKNANWIFRGFGKRWWSNKNDRMRFGDFNSILCEMNRNCINCKMFQLNETNFQVWPNSLGILNWTWIFVSVLSTHH